MAGHDPEPIVVDADSARYFHFPTSADVAGYLDRHRFFRIRDLLSLLLKPEVG